MTIKKEIIEKHGQTPINNFVNELNILALEQKHYSTLTKVLSSGAYLDDFLEHIYTDFRTVIPYDRITVAIINSNSDSITVRWVKSNSRAVHIKRGYVSSLRDSDLLTILENGEPRIISDIEKFLLENPQAVSIRLIQFEGVKSSLTFPLVTEGKTIGFIFFSSFQKDSYNEKHVEQFKLIVALVSLVVEKALLHERFDEISKEKKRMLGVAAHDLRSPLGIILGYVEILKEAHENGEIKEYEHLFNRVIKTCDDMLFLMNDLLDVSAIESGTFILNPKDIDLFQYFKDHLENQRVLARKKGIRLIDEIEKDLEIGRIDPERFGQVISNILGNAFKFSLPDTSVIFKVVRSGKRLNIQIKDEGSGFDPSKLNPIGTSFNKGTSKSTGNERGAGLGLAIVKKIINAHGGEMEIESFVGMGTKIELKIPI